MTTFEYRVVLFGSVIDDGEEEFSSPGNCELMLRARWAHLLTGPFQRCWNMIEVVLL